MTRRPEAALALVLGAYVVTVLAVHPFGDVLYGGDDWAYGWSVRIMAEEGHLRASPWVTAAAVPQTLLASAVGKIFGVHPRILNATTLVVSFFGVACLYFAAKGLELERKRAALLTLVCTLNPLYLGFAGSFMSDTYYVVLLMAAMIACFHALRRGSPWSSALGGALASLAYLNRQVGLTIPLAFGVAVLASYRVGRLGKKATLTSLGAGAAVPALTLVAHKLFRDAFGGVTTAQRLKMSPEKMWARFLEFGLTAQHAYLAVIYTAIFTSPLVFALLRGSRFREVLGRRGFRILFGALMIVSLGLYAAELKTGETFVVRGEFLNTASFGPSPLAVMPALWVFLGFVGSVVLPVTLTLLVERLTPLLRRPEPSGPAAIAADRTPEIVFLAVCFAGHLALLAAFIAYYNNYFLPLLPLVGALVVLLLEPAPERPASRSLWIGFALVVLTALGSVVLLDRHARYVEADARATEAVIAAGTDSRRVFGFASYYAWNHNDLVVQEIERKPWGPLERIRNRSDVLVMNDADKPKGRWRRAEEIPYPTLLGASHLTVWRKR